MAWKCMSCSASVGARSLLYCRVHDPRVAVPDPAATKAPGRTPKRTVLPSSDITDDVCVQSDCKRKVARARSRTGSTMFCTKHS